MQRRELFGSLASLFKTGQERLIIRPPYCSDETAFAKACHTCAGRCATFCEERIIEIGKDKTPHLSFAKSGCTYCDACALACEPEVLRLEEKTRVNALFSIESVKCLSWHGVMCFSCKEPCQDDAISFTGVFKPVIDPQKCTACGFCVGVCPADAIAMEMKQ